MEGYLLMWSESGDEVHIDLINREHYLRIIEAMKEKTEPPFQALVNAERISVETEPIASWFTQTYCNEPWPYSDVKILGTVSVTRT